MLNFMNSASLRSHDWIGVCDSIAAFTGAHSVALVPVQGSAGSPPVISSRSLHSQAEVLATVRRFKDEILANGFGVIAGKSDADRHTAESRKTLPEPVYREFDHQLGQTSWFGVPFQVARQDWCISVLLDRIQGQINPVLLNDLAAISEAISDRASIVIEEVDSHVASIFSVFDRLNRGAILLSADDFPLKANQMRKKSCLAFRIQSKGAKCSRP